MLTAGVAAAQTTGLFSGTRPKVESEQTVPVTARDTTTSSSAASSTAPATLPPVVVTTQEFEDTYVVVGSGATAPAGTSAPAPAATAATPAAPVATDAAAVSSEVRAPEHETEASAPMSSDDGSHRTRGDDAAGDD